MKQLPRPLWWLALVLPGVALGRGVSPYLPLNLEPEIESQIERVLILAQQPVMTRPIPAATVLEALPRACKIDAPLCNRVRRYLARYTHNLGISEASIEAATSSGAGQKTVAPNRYGMEENSHWDASAQVYWQPNDYVLLDLGAVGYEGRTNFSGSMLSIGFDVAQLDIGFRQHWFSPMSDSSMLMSTEAPTMPSVTLSNYRLLTRLGLHYELFAARMSESDRIVDGNGLTAGHPKLAGLHLDIQPATGWSLGINRLIQYGGGALGGSSLHDLLRAFFNPSAAQTPTGTRQAFGNQEASFTSTLLFPGRVPFAAYLEYAGEDTSRGKNYLLGNSSLSAGIHFPRLFEHFDLTLEASEWQNQWYTHTVYLDGMTNYGRVLGNWFGDQRVFPDSVGGRSAMAEIGYTPPFGGLIQLRYRTLQNQNYGLFRYQTFHDLSLGYSHPWRQMMLGAQLDTGRDVFGGNFLRLAGFARYDGVGGTRGFASSLLESAPGSDETPTDKAGEIFIDTGANANRQSVNLTAGVPHTRSATDYGYHVALGARRFVSNHSDLGVRLEVDDIQGHNLLAVRGLDYRYRFNTHIALSVFVGAGRYPLATPAYGIYYGGGLQWLNVIPGWDLGADLRYFDTLARDHLLPSDPPNVGARNDSFYNVLTPTLSISRHF